MPSTHSDTRFGRRWESDAPVTRIGKKCGPEGAAKPLPSSSDPAEKWRAYWATEMRLLHRRMVCIAVDNASSESRAGRPDPRSRCPRSLRCRGRAAARGRSSDSEDRRARRSPLAPPSAASGHGHEPLHFFLLDQDHRRWRERHRLRTFQRWTGSRRTLRNSAAARGRNNLAAFSDSRAPPQNRVRRLFSTTPIQFGGWRMAVCADSSDS